MDSSLDATATERRRGGVTPPRVRFRRPGGGPRQRLPAAFATVLLGGLPLGAAQSPPPDRPAGPDSVDGLRAVGLGILESLRESAASLEEARAGVERLRRALVALGEAEGWTPERRRLELSIARPDDPAAAPIEDCPLFLEEDLVRLCPLDQSRSELWSDQVVVCVYACAPESSPPGSLPSNHPPPNHLSPGSPPPDPALDPGA